MDTIVAISTALGNGAISIIRLSGDKAIEIVNNNFKGKNLNEVESHTINYGFIENRGEFIDEVLVSVFRTPKTYTTEDIVEINCHGGIFITNKILELMVESGARLAEPGEFTKRAFLNGRIDLTKAEAVMDVINSQTENSLKCAKFGLRGDVYMLIKSFRDKLLDCILKIEVNIDYPEYDEEFVVTNKYLKPKLNELKIDLNDILDKAKTSSIIKDGITTAIIGKPNVGKSSLLNTLLRENRAIVTNIAGTTRDTIEGRVCVGGIILNLVDTAGIRETYNEVERIGVEKTKEILSKADLIILVLDNNTKLNKTDKDLLKLTEDKNRIVVINKIDLKKQIDYQGEAIEISLLNEKAAEILEDKIKEIFNLINVNNIDATYIGNTRQISKIKEAKKSIEDALYAIELKYPVDIINIDITNAWNALGEIIGENNQSELIDSLFKNYCLGK